MSRLARTSLVADGPLGLALSHTLVGNVGLVVLLAASTATVWAPALASLSPACLIGLCTGEASGDGGSGGGADAMSPGAVNRTRRLTLLDEVMPDGDGDDDVAVCAAVTLDAAGTAGGLDAAATTSPPSRREEGDLPTAGDWPMWPAVGSVEWAPGGTAKQRQILAKQSCRKQNQATPEFAIKGLRQNANKRC